MPQLSGAILALQLYVDVYGHRLAAFEYSFQIAIKYFPRGD
jgi:hypothetical protein